jgi:hypothetical protein
VREFVWNDRIIGFAAIFDTVHVVTCSYHACIDDWMVLTKGAPRWSYQKQNLTNAFRLAIRHQMRRVRDDNDLLGEGKDWHVGHDWENNDAFKEILQDFISVIDIDFKKLTLEWKQGEFRHMSPFLTNSGLEKSWIDYHAIRAAGMRMERAQDNLRAKC